MSIHTHDHGKKHGEKSPEQGTSAHAQPSEAQSVSGTQAEAQAAEYTANQTAPSLETQLAEARAEIELLKIQLAELNDKYLRALAEQVNFRKRMVKDKEDAQKYAIQTLLVDLIPVLDDFDRSIDAALQSPEDGSKVLEGVRLIRKHFMDMLETKYGLRRFSAQGAVFDPHLHEAMFSDTGEVAEPTVTQEFMPGYMLHDRVIRSAKVKVTMPAKPAPQPEQSSPAAEPAGSEQRRDQSEAAGAGSEEPQEAHS
ncbi:MAG: nucleotide exchange factor GrpE [Rectinema sp.]|nr:nucleotide exchange factor GrpE [Rectinema sp.]